MLVNEYPFSFSNALFFIVNYTKKGGKLMGGWICTQRISRSWVMADESKKDKTSYFSNYFETGH